MISRQKEDARLLGTLFAEGRRRILRSDLARSAGIDPAELENRLAPYIEAGYPIEFHPQGGVEMGDPPDIWCAEEIVGRCPARTDLPAWDPLLLTETASTNDVAREQGRRGARAGFIVAASRQTRGRGRLGRMWESAQDQGLYMSVLLRPELTTGEAGQLAILASVSGVDAVETVCGVRPQIKWPNDLMAGGRKLGGLLIETEVVEARLAFAVMGIGINVRQTSDDFSPEVRELATSLYLLTGRLHRRVDLLVALLEAFERRLTRPLEETRAAWAASSLTLGQRVLLTTARGPKHGQALGLDESGALLLRNDSGEVETITAGDLRAV